MVRIIVICVLVLYILGKISKLLFFTRSPRQPFVRRPDRNRNVDPKSNRKNTSKIRGGEYIDFEEVK